MSQVLSSLLSTRENGLMVNLLGSDCSASACAVVQLYLATKACRGERSEWQMRSCGVVCLVQDKKLHSTFLRLFCVKRARLLWEQELYIPFTYLTPRPFFHTFHSDECWAGLNFSDEDEASQFHTAVQKCISVTKVHPTFTRTHSLDSASGLLLRNKLKTCLSLSRSASPKAPASVGSEVISTTLSLAQRKGPLPPIPSNREAETSIHHDEIKDMLVIPLPPSYPAPNLKMNLTAVKKSASFSPGANYYTYEKQQRRLYFTDDI